MTKFLKNMFFCALALSLATGGCFAEDNNNGKGSAEEFEEKLRAIEEGKFLQEPEEEYGKEEQKEQLGELKELIKLEAPEQDKYTQAYEGLVDSTKPENMAGEYTPELSSNVKLFLRKGEERKGEEKGNINFVPEGKTKTVCDILLEAHDGQSSIKEAVDKVASIERALVIVFQNGGMPFELIEKWRAFPYERKRKIWEVGGLFTLGMKNDLRRDIKNILGDRSKNEELMTLINTPKNFLQAPIRNDGKTLLHQAAYYGHFSLFRLLVNGFELDVNLLDDDKQTCIYSLFEGASLKDVTGSGKYMEILKFSLKRTELNLNQEDDEKKKIQRYVNDIYESKKQNIKN